MRSFLAVAATTLLIAPAASAANMMPPGSSPESGFAGVWRFTGAKSAPWVKPRKLSKTDVPLLEYAVEFADGEVKGPAALACTGALYSSGASYQGDLFGGKLAHDKNGAMAKAVHLSQGGTGTYRVICGKKVRDYYFDDKADMVSAEGDVIYTLERPTGMDPEQYTAGFSGPSFDCAKANATGDRLICSDAALSKSDKKLGAAYLVLRKSESPEGFATFQAAERAWLVYVMKSCGADVPMPEFVGDRNPITECLNTAYGDRADLLGGLKTERAGALVIEPRVRFRTRTHPDTEESDIYPVMSGEPQATAFNAFVFKALKLDKWRMDDKSLFRYGNEVNDMKLHAWRFYSVARFDGRIVSLAVSMSDFVGGHDEERSHAGFNWDMAKARPISFDDVFDKGRDWKKFATDYCAKDLRKRTKADNMPAEIDDADVSTTIANSADWLWGEDKATVMFTIFMDSGMPEEEYDVDIPYKLLRRYMRPAAPVL